MLSKVTVLAVVTVCVTVVAANPYPPGADPGFPGGRFTAWVRMRANTGPRPFLENHAHKRAASTTAR